MNEVAIRAPVQPSLEGGSFNFRLQPIVHLRSGQVRAFELLVDGYPDWSTKRRQLWYRGIPGLLIDLTSIGLITELRQLAINVSTNEIMNERCWQHVESAANERVIVEWRNGTDRESSVQDAGNRLMALRRRTGCLIAIDGVGAGIDGETRQGLVYPDLVKLDWRFIKKATESGSSMMRLFNLVSLFQDTGADIVIGWIDASCHRRIAITAGAEYGQGWLWPRRHGWVHSLKGQVSVDNWIGGIEPLKEAEV